MSRCEPPPTAMPTRRVSRSDVAEDDAAAAYSLSATCDFLNRELAACGFPSPLRLYKGEESNNDETRRIIDCLFAMLQQHQVRWKFCFHIYEKLTGGQ